jgi:hypothetical protein
MENTASLYGLIEPVTRKYFGLEMKAKPAQFSQIFDVNDVDDPIHDFVEVGGPGQLSFKAENAPVTTGAIKQGPIKRVQAATFAGGMQLSREVIKDARYKAVKSASSSIGRATRLTPEYLAAQFLDRSFDSNFPVTPDGVELCSSSHLLPDGVTTASNIITAAALSESSLEDVLTALRTVPGPDGMLSPETAKQLIVPSALHNLAEKLRRTKKTLGSNYNDESVVAGLENMTFDYLTNQTRWFVQTDNTNGIFWDYRERPEFIRDNISQQLAAYFVAFFRAMWGCEDWRGIFGSNAT